MIFFKTLWMIQAVFISISYREYSFDRGAILFLIPGFVSLNVQLELVGRENLWPIKIFLYVFKKMYCVCVCLFAYMHVHVCPD